MAAHVFQWGVLVGLCHEPDREQSGSCERSNEERNERSSAFEGASNSRGARVDSSQMFCTSSVLLRIRSA